eukprot:3006407-Rhodomonas_salina.1
MDKVVLKQTIVPQSSEFGLIRYRVCCSRSRAFVTQLAFAEFLVSVLKREPYSCTKGTEVSYRRHIQDNADRPTRSTVACLVGAAALSRRSRNLSQPLSRDQIITMLATANPNMSQVSLARKEMLENISGQQRWSDCFSPTMKKPVNQGSPSALMDRFIPRRSSTPRDLSTFHDNHSPNSSLNAGSCEAETSPAKQDYRNALRDVIMPPCSPKDRVLNLTVMTESPPLSPSSRLSICLPSESPAVGSPNKGKRRAARLIPKSPDKILDAPDIVDDYYLNLLDWSPSNILAVRRPAQLSLALHSLFPLLFSSVASRLLPFLAFPPLAAIFFALSSERRKDSAKTFRAI